MESLAVSAKGCDGRINHYEHEEDVCVLSAIGAQCGKMFFPQEKFTAIKNTITLKPKKELVYGKFLYYLFTFIELPKRGAAQPFISKGDIEKFEIDNLPELEVQQQIIAKLDAALADIDKMISLKKKFILNLDKFFSNQLNNFFLDNSNNWESTTLGTYYDVRDGTHDSLNMFPRIYHWLLQKFKKWNDRPN